MNITQTTKGDNLISIKINVEKTDYEETVNKAAAVVRAIELAAKEELP